MQRPAHDSPKEFTGFCLKYVKTGNTDKGSLQILQNMVKNIFPWHLTGKK
jgi:hypothetical protein